MSWYLIELPDGAPTPYATEKEGGTVYGWGDMPKRKIDLGELLKVAADMDGVTDWAERIRKAVGE